MVQNQKHATDSPFMHVIQLFNLKQLLEMPNSSNMHVKKLQEPTILRGG